MPLAAATFASVVALFTPAAVTSTNGAPDVETCMPFGNMGPTRCWSAASWTSVWVTNSLMTAVSPSNGSGSVNHGGGSS